MIEDVIIKKLDIIDVPGGSVLHGIKKSSKNFYGFGEAYFSQINHGAVKAWKKHYKMTMNLFVPFGKIKFVLYDDRNIKNPNFQEIIISNSNYCSLTIPPEIWLGFQGLANNQSLLLNVANIEHDDNEVERKDRNSINYDWSI